MLCIVKMCVAKALLLSPSFTGISFTLLFDQSGLSMFDEPGTKIQEDFVCRLVSVDPSCGLSDASVKFYIAK